MGVEWYFGFDCFVFLGVLMVFLVFLFRMILLVCRYWWSCLGRGFVSEFVWLLLVVVVSGCLGFG